jgi:mono/diheme cytochrome c family protein
MKPHLILLVPISIVGILGCSKGGGGGSADVEAQAEAAKIFIQRCTMCHGASGAGDGPAAANLSPKPRNLQDPAWQASVDDAYIEKIIKLGGMGVGKSASMPPNPDLASNEAVVKALRIKVRELKR